MLIRLCWNVHQLHVAADAGALTGAQVVKYNTAEAILWTHDFAFRNTADKIPVDVSVTPQADPLTGDEETIVGRRVRQQQKFYPTIFGASAVKVFARRVSAHNNVVGLGDAGYMPNLSGEDGIALWQDRDNPLMATILGTAGSFIKGVIYCGYNAMEVGRNADQMGTQLIVGCLRNHGNLTLSIAYDGRNAVVVRQSALVE
jgi:hypothetical protein